MHSLTIRVGVRGSTSATIPRQISLRSWSLDFWLERPSYEDCGVGFDMVSLEMGEGGGNEEGEKAENQSPQLSGRRSAPCK
jgi:hypothetical protein